MRRTKIVCTIGPASRDRAMMEKMIRAGMAVARLNFSHGTHEQHAAMIADLRAAAAAVGEPLALLQDLQGPKIRVGELPEGGVLLKDGEAVVLSTAEGASLPKIPVGYPDLHKDVKAGDRILLDDGLLELSVTSVKGHDIACDVVHGGPLTSHKGINVPTASISAPAITDKDREDAIFGVQHGVDLVALSFVKTPSDIRELRKIIQSADKGKRSGYDAVRIVAKIEKHEAVADIVGIIREADAIMVARGDLGIETPAEQVPVVQKMIIEECLAMSTPVIVATQMLDSMIRNPRPTRAETSDVANAVIDHADAVMLSGESASGKYPLESVETMARIVEETEASAYDDLAEIHELHAKQDTEEEFSDLANILARDLNVKLILAGSLSGNTGRVISRYRPPAPIIVAADTEIVRNQLNLSWGVTPILVARCETPEELVTKSIEVLKEEEMVKTGDKIVVVGGHPVGFSGGINFVEVHKVE